jgi:hypothetical protein
MTVTSLQKWFAPAKRILPPAVWSPIRAVMTAVLTPIRFSRRTGHWRSSLRRAALSAGGAPIPWYTYPAIDFLQQRSFENCDVLEFGSGQSTLWWSRRARSVLTIEEDEKWYKAMRPRIGPNVSLNCVPVDHVTRTVEPIRALLASSAVSKFDVIIVDGHLRKEATSLAFDYLAPDGALILDNAEGYGFYDEVKGRRCRRIDFFGFAPGVSLRHCTSLVFVDDCFLLRPDIPIPQLEVVEESGSQVRNA